MNAALPAAIADAQPEGNARDSLPSMEPDKNVSKVAESFGLSLASEVQIRSENAHKH